MKTITNTKAIFKTILLILVNIPLIFLHSCKKLVEVDAPVTSISGKNVYTNNSTSAAVLTGLYTRISTSGVNSGDLISISFLTGLSGDELTLYSGSGDNQLTRYYSNSLIASNIGYSVWSNIYPKIFVVNSAIEGITGSSSLLPKVKQQLLGESRFMRAFLYFYLVNLYGDVPLVLSTDYTKNNVLPRTPKSDVWTQIISDLKEAKILLTPSYLDATLLKTTDQRVRPNKWAASSLLARSYLYTGNWKNAESESSEVIANSSLFQLDSLNGIFLANSREAIWQLQPVNFGANTEDARTYIIPETGLSYYNPVYLSNEFLNSFESNDQRKINWIDSIESSGTIYHYPFKYKVVPVNTSISSFEEYNTVLRLGEQYLIRAEARAQLDNIDGSLSDLNIIRKRAGLKDTHPSGLASVLKAIYHERQVELFTEWGHRWLDLKRTQNINTVMNVVTPLKGGSWSPNWQLYPIPPTDILLNGNITQNIGY